MPTRQQDIQVVLVYEHKPEEGKAIAAVAWLGEDLAIVPAREAPPGAVARLRFRLGRPVGEKVKQLFDLGYTSDVQTVVATDTSEAARMVLREEGLLG